MDNHNNDKPAVLEEIVTEERVIAFTFDDGPDVTYTTQLLDIFREAGGKATFFMVGEAMERHPELVREVHTSGHEIGNHTYTHPFLTQLSAEDCMRELTRSDEQSVKLTGSSPKVFRPPYFDYNQQVADAAESLGYVSIGALNGAARDWEQPGVAHIADASRAVMRSGSILIFHDGMGDRSQTVDAVRMLVREATEQGYRLVTVSELMELRAR